MHVGDGRSGIELKGAATQTYTVGSSMPSPACRTCRNEDGKNVLNPEITWSGHRICSNTFSDSNGCRGHPASTQGG